ncbi:MAG: Holliday junction resolvase RuvX [bacterium]
MENGKKRILALDYGDRRIGIAMSDPLQILAHPIETIENNKNLIPTLSDYISRYAITQIVVGMPYNLKGQKEKKAQQVDEFIQRLKHGLEIEIITWDERFTSVIAHKTLLEMGTTKKDRRDKGRIDTMAAAILLQSYLDSKKRSLRC